jgi:hypothetical protein
MFFGARKPSSKLFTKRCTDLKWMGASTEATRP